MIKTELIENFFEEHHLSKTKFCKICKISLSTLKKILNNENVNLIAVYKVSKVLGIYLHQMFKK